jgi:DNA replication licensing factor MCM4
VDQLVSVRGMVIRISSVIPEPRTGFFQCSACNNTVVAEVDRGIITG